LTGGVFDVSIGTGLDSLELDADACVIGATRRGVKIDLGGVGKGYAVDLMAEVLEEWGVERALVHGGFSSVLALEPPPGREGWPLTLSTPGARSRVFATVSPRQTAMGASGVRKADHIVNPRTGEPVRDRIEARRHQGREPAGPAGRVGPVGGGSLRRRGGLRALHCAGHQGDPRGAESGRARPADQAAPAPPAAGCRASGRAGRSGWNGGKRRGSRGGGRAARGQVGVVVPVSHRFLQEPLGGAGGGRGCAEPVTRAGPPVGGGRAGPPGGRVPAGGAAERGHRAAPERATSGRARRSRQ